MLLVCLLLLGAVGLVSYLILAVGAEPRPALERYGGAAPPPEENRGEDAA